MKTNGPKKNRPVKVSVKRVSSSSQPVASSDGTPELDELLAWQTKPVNMQTIDRGPRRRRWPLILLLVLGTLFAVTAVGFVMFTRGSVKFDEPGVKLSLEVPTSVASGEEVAITVSYLNNQAVDLKSAELTLSYAEGFTVVDAVPAAEGPLKNTWVLGTIRSGFGGQIVIRGLLVGTLQSQREFAAALAYKPANFNSEFTTKAQAVATIESSRLSLEVKGPSRIVPGTGATITVVLSNTSTEEQKGVKVLVDPADGFAVANAEPATADTDTWILESLAAGEKKTLKLTGTFTGEVGAMREVKFRVGLVDSAGAFTLQNSQNLIVTLINPELTFSVALTKPTNAVPRLGDTLTYTATYRNNSDYELKKLVVTATFKGGVYHWEKVDATPSANLAEAAQGTIVWDAGKAPTLAAVKPGEERTLELSVPLIEALQNPTKADKEFSLETVWTVKSDSVESLGGPIEVKTDPLVTKVGTTAKLVAEARYYEEEGNAIGSGPLPPQVGKTTSYRINWILSNTTNDLSDVTVQTTLPETAFWTGKVQNASAGTLVFDSTTRKVTWTINRVPAGTGSLSAQLVAAFEVSVTPKPSDVGLLMVLTEKTAMAGMDTFTGQTVGVESPQLTTELTNDIQGRSKGIVIAAQ